ncbi:MAG: Gfo/Idh/MocA family protein, partial [Terrimicrobiaceae bacterium]
RRFYWADRFVKNALKSGVLGEIVDFQFENGYPYAWPSASPFILSRAEAGGGVIMGLGSHVLDTMLWWLGQPSASETWTDARGGLDSECLIHFEMPGGARGSVELSRSRTLSNSVTIRGTQGILHAPFYGNRVEIQLDPSGLRVCGVVAPRIPAIGPVQDVATVMAEQIQDWIRAVRDGFPPAASGKEAMASISLIESCIATQREMDLPWTKPLTFPTP